MNIIRVPQTVGRPRTRPSALAGDKAYCSKPIRDWLKQHKIAPIIPTKSNQEPDPDSTRNPTQKKHRGMLHRLAKGSSPHRHAIREAGGKLSDDDQTGNNPANLAGRITGQSLVCSRFV